MPLGEGGGDLDVGGDEGLAPGSGVSVEGPMEAESPLGDLIKIFSKGEVVLNVLLTTGTLVSTPSPRR